jgi:hypothetical protein
VACLIEQLGRDHDLVSLRLQLVADRPAYPRRRAVRAIRSYPTCSCHPVPMMLLQRSPRVRDAAIHLRAGHGEAEDATARCASFGRHSDGALQRQKTLWHCRVT